ncbi:transposase, Ptta/En/Spm [Tanacetum coccineum]|uniref:Transposase, Ptta/En/Spm n=1 Tax=Tanacetum coccineum TaxID=301880 RepID=A0ABQ4Z145_9ASTR
MCESYASTCPSGFLFRMKSCTKLKPGSPEAFCNLSRNEDCERGSLSDTIADGVRVIEHFLLWNLSAILLTGVRLNPQTSPETICPRTHNSISKRSRSRIISSSTLIPVYYDFLLNASVTTFALPDGGIPEVLLTYSPEIRKQTTGIRNRRNVRSGGMNEACTLYIVYRRNVNYVMFKAISEKKKIVCSKSYEPHALGTKSFARLADEEKKKTGVLPTRGTLYIMSCTKKNGSIVNATAAKVIKELLNDASTSTSNTTNDVTTSTSNTTTGPNIRLPRSKRSCVSQVPMLKAKINELEVELKDLKERQHIEMKEMKENKTAILQFMAKYKNHNSNEDFSNVLNTTNTEVANDSSSVHNPGPYGNSASTRASEHKKSDKVVTSPGAELMKLHQQFVMSGIMSDNEFWCIRKTLKTLKRDDVQLLRKFGIQFKGDSKQVRLQLPEAPFESSKIIREVFVKLLLDSFGKLSIRIERERLNVD